MKINFDDKSYIEFQKCQDSDNVMIVILAKDHLNNLKNIINSVEVTPEQLKKLIDSIHA